MVKFRRKMFIEARSLALAIHGYPEDWSPNGGEVFYANFCRRSNLPVVVRARVHIDCDDPSINPINSTIDIICPYCGRLTALRAFPSINVVNTFIEKFRELMVKK